MIEQNFLVALTEKVNKAQVCIRCADYECLSTMAHADAKLAETTRFSTSVAVSRLEYLIYLSPSLRWGLYPAAASLLICSFSGYLQEPKRHQRHQGHKGLPLK